MPQQQQQQQQAPGSPRGQRKPKANGRPKALDVSNGKALYYKYQPLQYNSITQGNWIDVEVIMVREDGAVMIDLKEGYWFTVEEQKSRFRARARKTYAPDTELQYHSVTQGGWVDCSVIRVNAKDQSIMINLKENYWMSVAEQDEKLRLPCYDKFDELVWDASKLLDRDPPDREGAERKYLEVLQTEPDHIGSMLRLAELLADRGDLQGAEARWREVLNENPFEEKALSDLGDLLKIIGGAEEAKQLHKRWKRVRDKLKEIEEEG